MSRIAKNPVELPKGVEATLTDVDSKTEIKIKGPMGMLARVIPSSVRIEQNGTSLLCRATDANLPGADAMSGTMRALVNNMVVGVTKGFEKKLTLVGVGYKAQAQGALLNLSLGFSHPVVHNMPEGIVVTTPIPTEIIIKGVDKQRVGQVAAEIRAYRPPEPYKGKGVRYVDEVVIIKETKKK
ncbi:MAG: 50S ribosomal protein L6 [Rhodocyclaceae bacterium]|nr:50S ribosomal protein L6 [Rhodocyclaceae bacterium]